MSAVIKTQTPFVIKEALFEALEEAGAEPVTVNAEVLQTERHRGGLQEEDILTNRSDYAGRQFFRLDGEYWVLRHDSDELQGRVSSVAKADRKYLGVSRFLEQLSGAYRQAHERYLERLAEAERQRQEEARKARVEKTRQQAIAKARAQGFSVKETRSSGKIQLVLTRTV